MSTQEKPRIRPIPRIYHAGLHFLGTSAVSFPLIAYGIVTLSQIPGGLTPSDLVFIPVMLTIASLVEYATHRYPLHHRLPGSAPAYNQHTLSHHQYFTHDRIEAQNSREFFHVLFPVWGVAVLQYGLNLPLSFVLTQVFGPSKGALALILGPLFFFAYETVHAICHFKEDSKVFQVPGLWFLREHHRIHHHKGMMAHWNFNIVFPLWDWILGTRATKIASARVSQKP